MLIITALLNAIIEWIVQDTVTLLLSKKEIGTSSIATWKAAWKKERKRVEELEKMYLCFTCQESQVVCESLHHSQCLLDWSNGKFRE